MQGQRWQTRGEPEEYGTETLGPQESLDWESQRTTPRTHASQGVPGVMKRQVDCPTRTNSKLPGQAGTSAQSQKDGAPGHRSATARLVSMEGCPLATIETMHAARIAQKAGIESLIPATRPTCRRSPTGHEGEQAKRRWVSPSECGRTCQTHSHEFRTRTQGLQSHSPLKPISSPSSRAEGPAVLQSRTGAERRLVRSRERARNRFAHKIMQGYIIN